MDGSLVASVAEIDWIASEAEMSLRLPFSSQVGLQTLYCKGRSKILYFINVILGIFAVIRTRLERLYFLRIHYHRHSDTTMKALWVILLLVLSNSFMVMAWYGHLKFSEWNWSQKLGLISIILISWGIALFEYMFQVPANRIGFKDNGGPFTLIQLKVIQEVITLVVFAVFTLIVFKTETFRLNHIFSFVFLILAVYFMFKK